MGVKQVVWDKRGRQDTVNGIPTEETKGKWQEIGGAGGYRGMISRECQGEGENQRG